MKHVNVSENRLIQFKISENYGDFGKDTYNTYVAAPLKNKEYIRAAIGVPAAGVRTVFEGLDPLWEGALDRKLDQLNVRTWRDVKEIAGSTAAAVGNLLTLHPVKSLKNVGGVALGIFRVPQSVPLDIMDGVGGYSKHRNETRAKINSALAA